MAGTATNPKRDEIVDRAFRLFYEGGFHATGVDAIVEGTGISKRTLYKHFPSKEVLIEAVLHKYLGDSEAILLAPAVARGGDARGRIRAVFEVRRELMAAAPCQGCLVMKAAGEFAGKQSAIDDVIREAMRQLEAWFAQQCAEAGLADAGERGRQINLLFQGAVQMSQLRGDTEAFDAAVKALEKFL